MLFSRSPSRTIREFSLAELVAKIGELERRRRADDDDVEKRDAAGDRGEYFGRRTGDHERGPEPELTE